MRSCGDGLKRRWYILSGSPMLIFLLEPPLSWGLTSAGSYPPSQSANHMHMARGQGIDAALLLSTIVSAFPVYDGTGTQRRAFVM